MYSRGQKLRRAAETVHFFSRCPLHLSSKPQTAIGGAIDGLGFFFGEDVGQSECEDLAEAEEYPAAARRPFTSPVHHSRHLDAAAAAGVLPGTAFFAHERVGSNQVRDAEPNRV